MKIIRTSVNGIKVIKTQYYEDKRGKFGEIFSHKNYSLLGLNVSFVQDNFSITGKNFLRGLHYRKYKPQAQLLTVLEGEIFDVLIDLRTKSKTFGQWLSFNLSADGKNQIFMDAGFAHGFYVKSNVAKIHYKVSEYYDPNDDFGIRWNDQNFKIDWPVKNPYLKERDATFPLVKDNKNNIFLEY